MNIIILIIANDSIPQYIEMQKIWMKYMNKHQNIKSFFIKNDINIDNDIILKEEENTIYCKDYETFIPGIYNKTIKSIEYCLNNFKFDYIYRTNLSSLIDVNKMYYFISNNKLDYGGIIGYYNNTSFVSGCGFFLSYDASKYLCNNHIINENNLYDDQLIALVLKDKFNLTFVNRHDIGNLDDNLFIYDDSIFHFRCKSDDWHNYTIPILYKLYDKIYNI
jgi:hypothetical protein